MTNLKKEDNLLKYQVALTLIPGVGPITGKKLVTYFGGVNNLFEQSKETILKIPGLGSLILDAIEQEKVIEKAEQEIEFITKNKITPLFYLDQDYPLRLKHCVDGPLLMYYKGNADLNKSKVLAIVGTRKPTSYGQVQCESIIEELKDLDLTIVSGLAYGIDSIAHKTALGSGMDTIGVLGHGLHTIYPAQNRKLASEMIKHGGILTEFSNGSKPDRENFPKRNRIVAGLSDAVLVIESAEKGGALITADIANSYNRDVFALPGKMTDHYSAGCNYLIKSNKAALVRGAEDIKYFMDWETTTSKQGKQQKLFKDLKPEERSIMEVLKQHGQLNIDQLSGLVQIGSSHLSAILLELEFEGLIKAMPGKIYKWV